MPVKEAQGGMVPVKLYQVALVDNYQYNGDRETWQKAVDVLVKAGLTPREWKDEDNVHYYLQGEDSTVLDKDTLFDLVVAGIKFNVKNEISVMVNITEELAKWADKPVNLLSGPSSANYNNKCEVHIPGQALSTYNDLMLLEDVCTDELQGQLNAGWRIIAACPQPDQRRPDYILGRFNPDVRVDGKGAERS